MSKDQSFQTSQLDKYEKMQTASERAKAFENGLAIATTLSKAMIQQAKISPRVEDVLANLSSLLNGASSLVESKLRALRLETEEAVLTPDVPTQAASGEVPTGV